MANLNKDHISNINKNFSKKVFKMRARPFRAILMNFSHKFYKTNNLLQSQLFTCLHFIHISTFNY